VCAKDTGLGLACGPACEEELKALRGMIERNRKVYSLAARTHARNAIWFTVLAVMLIAFGRIAQRGFMSSYLIVFGIVMLLGAAFSAFNSRRMSKL
jgi:lipopolysaccharide export LptBFGC system permease protein LptF